MATRMTRTSTDLKVHKRKGDEAEKTTPAKKTKQEEPAADGDEDDENKRTLFVRNLPFSVTDEQMQETFSPYGECQCRLIMDRERGTPKGIGFVEYATIAEMKAALAAENEIYVGDRQAFIKCAADPKGGPGGRGGARGGRGGGDRGGRGGRQSFGGGERQE